MKLLTKGSRGDRQLDYVAARHIPAEYAFGDTNVIFASFQNAADALLDTIDLMENKPNVQAAALTNYITLKKMYDNIAADMKKIGLTLRVVEKRLMDIGE